MDFVNFDISEDFLNDVMKKAQIKLLDGSMVQNYNLAYKDFDSCFIHLVKSPNVKVKKEKINYDEIFFCNVYSSSIRLLIIKKLVEGKQILWSLEAYSDLISGMDNYKSSLYKKFGDKDIKGFNKRLLVLLRKLSLNKNMSTAMESTSLEVNEVDESDEPFKL